MDNLTHSLVGLFLARSGFRHLSPRATSIMIVSANAPDLDLVSLLAGPSSYLRWHRNFTHSLIAIPVMALTALLLVRLIGRTPIRWLPSMLGAVVGVMSHVLLDLTNMYGVRLYLPFSGAWTHWDTVPVIDVWIWAILLLGIAAPFLSRLVSSEIGARERSVGAGWAVFSLLLLIGYDWARRDLHARALDQLESETYTGLAPRRVGALPEENPLLWDGLVELSSGYVRLPVRIGQNLDQNLAQTYSKAERTPAMMAAIKTDPFQRVQEFVQWPLWICEPAPDYPQRMRVSLMDLRFGKPKDAGFRATAIVSETGQVLETQFSFRGPKTR